MMNYHVAISMWLSGEAMKNEGDYHSLYKAIETVYGITREDMAMKNRKRPLVMARQMFCYIAHEVYGHRLKQIGKEFNQDHTTIMHAIASFKNLLETDWNGTKAKLDAIKKELSIIQLLK